MIEMEQQQALEATARICHEANAALCRAFGDDSQPAWDDAPRWQRESAIAGVEHAWGDLGAKPSDSHESWLKVKEAEGWVYGAVKDPDAKPPTHPCIVPFEELPPEQQAKDYIFLAIARSATFLAHAE